jgi:hypothetical protein
VTTVTLDLRLDLGLDEDEVQALEEMARDGALTAGELLAQGHRLTLALEARGQRQEFHVLLARARAGDGDAEVRLRDMYAALGSG